MKLSINTLGFPLLFILLAILCVLLFRPPGMDPLPQGSAGGMQHVSSVRAITTSTPVIRTVEKSPGEVAAIFATEFYIEKHADESVRSKETVVIDWIEPCGFYIGEEGRCFWFLKNNKTNTIMLLPEGGRYRGWCLVEKSSEEFLLEHNGKSYKVRSLDKR